MKLIFKVIILLVLSISISAREKGETEITTDDGIEVFQNEKYYLLKKNVKIESDNFTLTADDVKINFNKSLYDITMLDAKGNVDFVSQEFQMKGSGQKLNFEVKFENIKIEGLDSELLTEDIEMYSDGYIEVNNQNGRFSLKGSNSKLINEEIFIEGFSIDGIFTKNTNSNKKEITLLNVVDDKISFAKNNDTEMYAKKINFDNNTSLIELIDTVTIIRNGENITGDYGTLDTKNNSYKIKSNDQKKVKALILNNEQ